MVDRNVGCAGGVFEHLNNLLSDSTQFIEVVAEYLDDELAVCAGNLVVDVIDHWLAEPDRTQNVSRRRQWW